MSETRYMITVRTDAAHGLETVLQKSSQVLISLKAPAPWGPAGFDVTSIERQPRDGQPAVAVQAWDAGAESAARAETRAALRERAESYARDAGRFADMGGENARWAPMYRIIASELRLIADEL